MPPESSRSAYPRNLPEAMGLATIVALAIAATSYLPGARVQGATPQAPARIAAPILKDDEWTGGPRECDVLNGISTACVFMD